MKLLLLAPALFALGVGAAAAQDTTYDWSGAYVGVQAGYGWGNSDYNNLYGDFTEFDPDGFFGGVYAGYNYQLQSNIILGVDADINVSGLDGGGPFFHDFYDPSLISTDSEMKWNGAIRARLGYALDRFMPYIAGGFSFAKHEFSAAIEGTPASFQQTDTWTGWNIGVGGEYAMTDNILLRAEYRYTDYGNKNFGDLLDSNEGVNVDLSTHDLRFGIAYKF